MTPDQQYARDLADALEIAQSGSEVRQFEFLCAFNSKLLCLLEAEIRSASALVAQCAAIPLLRSVAALALQIQQPYFFRAADIGNVSTWCAGLTTYNGQALNLVRNALRTAHRELTPPTQPWEMSRWPFGRARAQLELHAKPKRELVALTLRRAYAVILVWVKTALREGRHREPGARAGALDAIDAALGIINQVAMWRPSRECPHDDLLIALAPFANILDTSAIRTGHRHLKGDFGVELAALTAASAAGDVGLNRTRPANHRTTSRATND